MPNLFGHFFALFSDGWCIQGASYTGSTQWTWNLLLAFKDLSYSLTFANFGGTCYACKQTVQQVFMHDVMNANSVGYSGIVEGFIK